MVSNKLVTSPAAALSTGALGAARCTAVASPTATPVPAPRRVTLAPVWAAMWSRYALLGPVMRANSAKAGSAVASMPTGSVSVTMPTPPGGGSGGGGGSAAAGGVNTCLSALGSVISSRTRQAACPTAWRLFSRLASRRLEPGVTAKCRGTSPTGTDVPGATNRPLWEEDRCVRRVSREDSRTHALGADEGARDACHFFLSAFFGQQASRVGGQATQVDSL